MCIRDSIVSMHIQSVDQVKAIKTVKRKITDLDRSKIEEQKKAVRAGYDMDIIPSDLATYGSEAKKLLQDLQSRNERMFLVSFLVLNTADTPRQLGNNIFQACLLYTSDMDAILAGSIRAAIYCRLSKDDDLDGESASIANQRCLLYTSWHEGNSCRKRERAGSRGIPYGVRAQLYTCLLYTSPITAPITLAAIVPD